MPDLRSARLALPAFAALVGLVVLWRGSLPVYWTDFQDEGWPAYVALHRHGVGALLDAAPVYSGFLLLVGAPMTFAAGLFGIGDYRPPTGDVELVFAATALPCVLALGWLTLRLGRRAAALGGSWWHPFVVVAVAAPVAYLALSMGHPEELLASAAAVGGVLLARDGRLGPAIALLVLAAACKQWAVLALPAAALAAPDRGGRLLVLTLAGYAVTLGPLHGGAADNLNGTLVGVGPLFHAHQWLYPLGVAPAAGVQLPNPAATTVAPAWVGGYAHALIVALAIPLSGLWWWRTRGAGRNRDDALALLALLFLVRCVLDPWDVHYYHLPLVLALAAWEIRRGRSLPMVAVAVTAGVWLSFVTNNEHYGTLPYLLYMAWTVPLAGFLVIQLYGQRAAVWSPAGAQAPCASAHRRMRERNPAVP